MLPIGLVSCFAWEVVVYMYASLEIHCQCVHTRSRKRVFIWKITQLSIPVPPLNF